MLFFSGLKAPPQEKANSWFKTASPETTALWIWMHLSNAGLRSTEIWQSKELDSKSGEIPRLDICCAAEQFL
jgi:hypothetical protein